MIGEDCFSDGSFMVDMGESDFSTGEFRALLGSINAAMSKQRKGTHGTIK